MKRFILSVLLAVLLILATVGADAKTAYHRTALTGGAAAALDGIDGASLADGDFAFVMASNVLYAYILDASSGAAESSPSVIAPDSNAGTKRWLLQTAYGTGSVAADALWDAKGDLAVGTGSNTGAKLAVGTAYQVLHVNSDTPGWTSTLGATGTRLTKGWFTDLEITNYPTVGGVALDALFQAIDADLTNWAAITAPTVAAAGDLVVGSGANALTVISKGANNSIFGVNNAGTLGYYTNVKTDDSAAQFYSATASKGTFKVLLTSMSDGILGTFTPVCTGACVFTTETYGAGTYTMVDKTSTQTLTNKTLTTPAVTFDDVDGSATGDLSAANVSRTLVNSYGRAGAATLTLPAAAEGMTFIALVGTQHNSAWKIQRAGSDTITWSTGGTDTTGKTYFQETNQAVGSRVSCITYRSGASAYTWLCGSITGTWVTD